MTSPLVITGIALGAFWLAMILTLAWLVTHSALDREEPDAGIVGRPPRTVGPNPAAPRPRETLGFRCEPQTNETNEQWTALDEAQLIRLLTAASLRGDKSAGK